MYPLKQILHPSDRAESALTTLALDSKGEILLSDINSVLSVGAYSDVSIVNKAAILGRISQKRIKSPTLLERNDYLESRGEFGSSESHATHHSPSDVFTSKERNHNFLESSESIAPHSVSLNVPSPHFHRSSTRTADYSRDDTFKSSASSSIRSDPAYVRMNRILNQFDDRRQAVYDEVFRIGAYRETKGFNVSSRSAYSSETGNSFHTTTPPLVSPSRLSDSFKRFPSVNASIPNVSAPESNSVVMNVRSAATKSILASSQVLFSGSPRPLPAHVTRENLLSRAKAEQTRLLAEGALHSSLQELRRNLTAPQSASPAGIYSAHRSQLDTRNNYAEFLDNVESLGMENWERRWRSVGVMKSSPSNLDGYSSVGDSLDGNVALESLPPAASLNQSEQEEFEEMEQRLGADSHQLSELSVLHSIPPPEDLMKMRDILRASNRFVHSPHQSALESENNELSSSTGSSTIMSGFSMRPRAPESFPRAHTLSPQKYTVSTEGKSENTVVGVDQVFHPYYSGMGSHVLSPVTGRPFPEPAIFSTFGAPGMASVRSSSPRAPIVDDARARAVRLQAERTQKSPSSSSSSSFNTVDVIDPIAAPSNGDVFVIPSRSVKEKLRFLNSHYAAVGANSSTRVAGVDGAVEPHPMEEEERTNKMVENEKSKPKIGQSQEVLGPDSVKRKVEHFELYAFSPAANSAVDDEGHNNNNNSSNNNNNNENEVPLDISPSTDRIVPTTTLIVSSATPSVAAIPIVDQVSLNSAPSTYSIPSVSAVMAAVQPRDASRSSTPTSSIAAGFSPSAPVVSRGTSPAPSSTSEKASIHMKPVEEMDLNELLEIGSQGFMKIFFPASPIPQEAGGASDSAQSATIEDGNMRATTLHAGADYLDSIGPPFSVEVELLNRMAESVTAVSAVAALGPGEDVDSCNSSSDALSDAVRSPLPVPLELEKLLPDDSSTAEAVCVREKDSSVVAEEEKLSAEEENLVSSHDVDLGGVVEEDLSTICEENSVCVPIVESFIVAHETSTTAEKPSSPPVENDHTFSVDKETSQSAVEILSSALLEESVGKGGLPSVSTNGNPESAETRLLQSDLEPAPQEATVDMNASVVGSIEGAVVEITPTPDESLKNDNNELTLPLSVDSSSVSHIQLFTDATFQNKSFGDASISVEEADNLNLNVSAIEVTSDGDSPSQATLERVDDLVFKSGEIGVAKEEKAPIFSQPIIEGILEESKEIPSSSSSSSSSAVPREGLTLELHTEKPSLANLKSFFSSLSSRLSPSYSTATTDNLAALQPAVHSPPRAALAMTPNLSTDSASLSFSLPSSTSQALSDATGIADVPSLVQSPALTHRTVGSSRLASLVSSPALPPLPPSALDFEAQPFDINNLNVLIETPFPAHETQTPPTSDAVPILPVQPVTVPLDEVVAFKL